MILLAFIFLVVALRFSIPDRRARYVALGVVGQCGLTFIWSLAGFNTGFIFWALFTALGLWPMTSVSKRTALYDFSSPSGLLFGSSVVVLSIGFFAIVATLTVNTGNYFLFALPAQFFYIFYSMHPRTWDNANPVTIEILRKIRALKEDADLPMNPEKELELKPDVLTNAAPTFNDWDGIRSAIMECGSLSPEIRRVVQRGLDEIDRLQKTPVISVSVVGEFNSGKSTFINELVGKNVASSANEECTKMPMRLTYAKQRSIRSRTEGLWQSQSENDFLRQQKTYNPQVDLLELADNFPTLKTLGMDLVDTPGAGSKMEESAALSKLTLQIAQDSDACVILMDSAQDGSKSFLQFLNQVVQCQRRIFIFISRSDMRTDEELEEHRKITAPKLGKLLGISPEKILFVGKTARNHVVNPPTAFSKIADEISKQRALILEEKKERLRMDLHRQLMPLLSRQEEISNHRTNVALSLPTSFQEIWNRWQERVKAVSWDKIARELKLNGEAQRDLLTKQLREDLIVRLQEVWIDPIKKKNLANIGLREFQNKFRGHCLNSFSKNYEIISAELQAASEPVYGFFSRLGTKQFPLPTNSSDFVATEDFKRLLAHGPRDETELNLYLWAQVYGRIQSGLAAQVQEVDWEIQLSSFGQASSINAAMKLGGPLAAIAVAAFNFVTRKQQADERFLNHALIAYFNMTSEMNQHFATAIAEIPQYTANACEVMAAVLVCHRERLFKNDFESNLQELRSAAAMQSTVTNGLIALECLKSDTKVAA